MRKIVVLLVLWQLGCFNPSLSEGTVGCGPGGECHPGLRCCSDQLCWEVCNDVQDIDAGVQVHVEEPDSSLIFLDAGSSVAQDRHVLIASDEDVSDMHGDVRVRDTRFDGGFGGLPDAEVFDAFMGPVCGDWVCVWPEEMCCEEDCGVGDCGDGCCSWWERRNLSCLQDCP